ncbi:MULTISPECIES: FadR/GntR family transcriptional regulator [unclassified Streptomyces]|uniref:FadR/GntR family transcriptional regulator n=1 Tax=unclassified Streptomyces TaxID=2593676 RepID=UPI002DD7F84F|nr:MULTISPECIES: FadR/GntR family transcriptional regulator [unclassified Streptomyces]WSA95943.1 FadR family transcriptional regulator [Streptomyces sp. NBC_01795]WSB80358.1 FadR family transcriptional regulator [Streptomyces sp. NBC_01775]WSS11431.1 FadR family transcriptional regulator [Streptomyces sp. NBC_01186]WSS40145.1 FadR family transcriptional regulator [Streptomyces sp. NBC_01187]
MARYARRGIHGQTVEAIAHQVLAGGLAEGATLDLAALQEELGVSLTALRESLKVLAAKGMVDARQKRGTFIRPRSDWNLLDADVLRWQFQSSATASSDAGPPLLRDLDEVRGIVEPASVRLAAERRTDADLAALDGALSAMGAADNGAPEAVEADLAFHRALLAASHNELLERMEMVISTGLAARDRLVHGPGHHPEDPVPSHRAVLEAVRGQDPDAAEAAMRALLHQAAQDLAELRDF